MYRNRRWRLEADKKRERPHIEFTTLDDYLMKHPISSKRISTGFPALDRMLDGGIPVGSLVTLQGAPHAGKTSFAIQLAMRAAKGSAADVYFIMPDEGPRGTCMRAAQGFGIERKKLSAWPDEDAASEAMVGFGKKLHETKSRIYICDPDEEHVTVEHVIEEITWLQKGEERPVIIVFDSTQRQRLDDDDEWESERLRIKAIMAAMLKATRSGLDCIVINISHVNRSAYRNKRDEDNIKALAGGAESADIERQSDIIVHLDGSIDAVVRAQLVKNRVVTRLGSWSMRFDGDTAQFRELDEAEAAQFKADEDARKKLDHLIEIQTQVEEYLKKRGAASLQTGVVITKIRENVKGSNIEIKEAVLGMTARGIVEAMDLGSSTRYWLK